MNLLINTDLLFVGFAVAGAWLLGSSIYFSNTQSATARAFFLFTVVSAGWSIVNFASYRITDPFAVLWLIRGVLFFAIWHAFSFFLLAYHFPDAEARLSRTKYIILALWTAFVSLFVFTPFVYERVISVAPVVSTETGPGIILFGMSVLAFISLGIYQLAKKYRSSKALARRQYEFVFTGGVITFVLLLLCSFILPAAFDIADLGALGGLYLLPFIGATAYAILHYRLFNIKVAAVALVTFLLAAVTFFDVIFSSEPRAAVFRSIELALVLAFGVWLVRSVVREIRLREKVEALAHELEIANQQQESLLHFISHEVKGYLTKAQAAFAGLVQGDYGSLAPQVKTLAANGLEDIRHGVNTVMEILSASNLKRGTMQYKIEPFNFADIVIASAHELEKMAEEKKLAFRVDIEGDAAAYFIRGDRAQLKEHVVRNLIDNSIRYTPQGSIEVSLTKKGKSVVLAVKDTGVGISDEDKARLFTEGGKGKESIKINVHSTGYGLYIAKTVTEAHGGTIRAESRGRGEGSTFIVELPTM